MEREWAEQVFFIVEAALSFHAVYEIPVPVAVTLELERVMREVEAWQAGIKSDAGQMWIVRHSSIEGRIFMGGAVIIAEGHQRAHFQPYRQARGTVEQAVLDHRTVAAIHHEYGFLQPRRAALKDKDRERIQAKLNQPLVAGRMHSTFVFVGAEVEAFIPYDEGFFQFREQHHSADWRLGARGQQAVVAACVCTGNCGRSKAAEPVGFKPLPAHCLLEIRGYVLLEANHFALRTARLRRKP
jgi:hypothetical protein